MNMTPQMQICPYRIFQMLCGFDLHLSQLLTLIPQDRISRCGLQIPPALDKEQKSYSMYIS